MKPIRLLVLIASLTLTTSCGLLTHDAADQPQTSTISASSTAPPSALESPDNLEPLDQEGSSRLTPVSSSETSTAAGTIELLSVQGRGPKTGYQRDLFGEAWDDGATGVLWSGNGCRTRDDILARDLDGVGKRDPCVIISGEYVDPYTNKQLRFTKEHAEESPIDHIVPISFAWQMGAAVWSQEKRLQFANDPLNLVLTSDTANSAKGDSDPASWLPPNKAIRCAYVQRFAQVSLKYSMPVTPADKQIMLVQCSSGGA